MKKLIVSIFAFLLLIGGTVNAQNQSTKTPAERAKLQADNIKTALVLNEEQNTKVYAIVLASAASTDSLKKANPGPATPEFNNAKIAINVSRDSNIKAVLTPEQATQFEAKKAELFGPPVQ
jgi:Spy/CpxP family protein refolding chaperone